MSARIQLNNILCICKGLLARVQDPEVPGAPEEAAGQARGAQEEEEDHQVLRQEGVYTKIKGIQSGSH